MFVMSSTGKVMRRVTHVVADDTWKHRRKKYEYPAIF